MNAVSLIPSLEIDVCCMEWLSCFPSPGLEAVVLTDRTPAGQRRPYYHLDSLQGMVAFNAYVSAEGGFVEALGFRDKQGHVYTAGKPSTGAVKLSYHFAMGEALESIGCAAATNHSGIAIKVWEAVFLRLPTLTHLGNNQCLFAWYPFRRRISSRLARSAAAPWSSLYYEGKTFVCVRCSN